MKLKAKAKNGVISVKMLVTHIMANGRMRDPDGNPIPAHYITDLTATYNDEPVFELELGPSISKDPYLSYKFKGEPGGTLKTHWVDNLGQTEDNVTQIG